MSHLIVFFRMAKGSFLSVKRGKIGDVVGYQVTNSADKDKQGWRPYQPKVRNPQSDGQMAQRVKLAAVNNLYRDLKEVIRRSMENKKYGDESRRAWLSMALGQNFNGPWIPKGYTLGLPIDGVPLSVGSIVPISCLENNNVMRAMLPSSTGALVDPTTIGELSNDFITAGYLPGDQVTIVMGWVPLRLAFAWRTISFFINSDDTTTLESIGLTLVETGNDQTLGQDYIVFSAENQIDALAVIISRDGQTAGSHLRSTAYIGMTAQAAANWYSQGAYELAKRSYLNTAASNTNWPLDPGAGEYTPVVQSAFTRAGTEFTPVGIRVVDPGQNQFLCIYDGEGNNYYIESYESSSSSLRVFLTGTGATTTAQPTGMTTANSVDVYDTNNVAARLRAWLISKGVSPTVLPVRS